MLDNKSHPIIFDSDAITFSRWYHFKKLIWSKIGIVKPFVLDMDAWNAWDNKTAKEKPIRWFIWETVPDYCNQLFIYRIKRLLSDIKWGFIWRVIPKHRYNVIKPRTLPVGYYDPNTLMLHTNMHFLTQFVEYELDYGHIDWDEETQSILWKEMVEIYVWWTGDYVNRDIYINEKYPYPDRDDKEFMCMFSEKSKGTVDAIEWSRIADIRRNIQSSWEDEEQTMLIRLVNIRQHLWH